MPRGKNKGFNERQREAIQGIKDAFGFGRKEPSKPRSRERQANGSGAIQRGENKGFNERQRSFFEQLRKRFGG